MSWKKYRGPLIHMPNKQELMILLGTVALSVLGIIIVWLARSEG